MADGEPAAGRVGWYAYERHGVSVFDMAEQPLTANPPPVGSDVLVPSPCDGGYFKMRVLEKDGGYIVRSDDLIGMLHYSTTDGRNCWVCFALAHTKRLAQAEF